MNMDPFRTLVRTEGVRLYRDLPWRRTHDPYEIWLSEVMLQQTQVARVETRWAEWLDRFPSVFALAEAGTAEVLAAWQGMGYNRRALALKAAAEEVVRTYDGVFPTGVKELTALPGIGPATAQGIRSFAFDLPGVYLETNVRTVLLHHLFPDVPSVPDKELVPLVRATCPDGGACVLENALGGGDAHGLMGASGGNDAHGLMGGSADGGARDGASGPVRCDARGGKGGVGRVPARGGVSSGARGEARGEVNPFATPQDAQDTPRAWYYAMLDYGAYLKKTVPNPSRRAKAYTRQSRFEGSRRQKRAEIVRQLLDAQAHGEGRDLASLVTSLNALEQAAGRSAVERDLVSSILEDLAREGFCRERGGVWRIA